MTPIYCSKTRQNQQKLTLPLKKKSINPTWIDPKTFEVLLSRHKYIYFIYLCRPQIISWLVELFLQPNFEKNHNCKKLTS
jgi:phage/plasmid-associated DNA primase